MAGWPGICATEMAREKASAEVVFGADRIADNETNLFAAVKIVGASARR